VRSFDHVLELEAALAHECRDDGKEHRERDQSEGAGNAQPFLQTQVIEHKEQSDGRKIHIVKRRILAGPGRVRNDFLTLDSSELAVDQFDDARGAGGDGGVVGGHDQGGLSFGAEGAEELDDFVARV
jgi:hypothetical protein